MKNRIINYFIQGLLYTTPLALTAYVLIWALSSLDSIIPFDIPGLGLLTLLVGVTLIGFLGNFAVKTPLVKLVDGLLEKVPLVKLVYSSTKDVMKSLTGKKKGFENAVLVRMAPDSEVCKVGFVTDDTLKELGNAPEGYVMVYVPLALTIMGDMYVVPPSYVEPLNGKTGDIMKYIIAGGRYRARIARGLTPPRTLDADLPLALEHARKRRIDDAERQGRPKSVHGESIDPIARKQHDSGVDYQQKEAKSEHGQWDRKDD